MALGRVAEGGADPGPELLARRLVHTERAPQPDKSKLSERDGKEISGTDTTARIDEKIASKSKKITPALHTREGESVRENTQGE
mmetsp:Transcript_34357/g.84552  ORF Transcript_34357/g.84552 Transcript_34357/m.84552 type:complete len:84 (-) Transcript_34357:79-330(-)